MLREMVHPRRWLPATALLSAGFTASVVLVPDLRFAYDNAALQVATEVSIAITASLTAVLLHSRFRRTREVRDLALAAALALLAVGGALALAPQVADRPDTSFGVWAPAEVRLAAVVALAAGALLPARRLPADRTAAASRRAAAIVAGLVAVVVVVVLALGDALPSAQDPELLPEASGAPRILGNPVLLCQYLLAALLFGMAAVALGRRARRERDEVLLALAVGALLSAFARLNFLLFPSQYSAVFLSGDVLRLLSVAAFLTGCALEIRRAQQVLLERGADEERRRLARDLHDGMAQELAFLVQESRRLAAHPGARPELRDLVTAAQSALETSRTAISALVVPADEPIGIALARTVRQAAARVPGVAAPVVTVDAPPGRRLPTLLQTAVLHAAAEAATNAVRHGRAATLDVRLELGPPVRLVVADDGGGFDEGAGRADSHGLQSMRERVGAAGGHVTVTSAVGAGTTVEVVLP
jgi:signal transduction histidine kinase